MSYCSLEEAWGPSSICSRVTNKSGKKNNISYKIANEQDCSENNFMYNDLDNEDNYSLLPQKYNPNNLILDYNNNNTTNNNLSLDKPVELNEKLNDELDVKPHDLNYSHYSNFNELNNDDNIANEDMEQNNNKDIEEDIEKDIEKELDEDSSELKHFNNKINIEGFTNNTNTNIENFAVSLEDVMKRLDAIEAKLSNSNNKQNNVHDIILYIIIGVFILFALDSIFKIGRLTV